MEVKSSGCGGQGETLRVHVCVCVFESLWSGMNE